MYSPELYVNLIKRNLISSSYKLTELEVLQSAQQSDKLIWLWHNQQRTQHSCRLPFNMLLSNDYICKYALSNAKFQDRVFVAWQRVARAVIKV